MRSVCASSMKSALTVRVPCQTLVMMSGIAVMNTTKIVVALDTPNQMIAKIAQIAEDTVDDALDTLSSRERQEFTRLTARVKGRLQSLAEPAP